MRWSASRMRGNCRTTEDRDVALQSRQWIPNTKLRACTKAKVEIIQPLQISDSLSL
jgi:hypothetical protein